MESLVEHSADMSEEELSLLQVFIENKLPGITRIRESDIFRWFELYMVGKAYKEIAELTNNKLTHVLYIAHKAEWHRKRLEHYGALTGGMSNKLTKVKLDSADTIASIIMALNGYLKKKADGYLSTGNTEIIESLDTKLLAQYYKSIDSLEKIVNPESRNRGKGENAPPGVNIIIGNSGQSMTSGDGKAIEINDENAGKILEAMAGAKKQDEKEK